MRVALLLVVLGIAGCQAPGGYAHPIPDPICPTDDGIMTRQQYARCYRPELTVRPLITRGELREFNGEYNSYRENAYRQQALDLERERIAIEREKLELLRGETGGEKE